MKSEIEQLIKHHYIQQGAENSLLNANHLNKHFISNVIAPFGEDKALHPCFLT